MNSSTITFADLTSFNASGLRIGIVAAAWHDDIVQVLLQGALDVFMEHNVPAEHIHVHRCPGSYEIPVVAKALIEHTGVDAVIALGVVVRGETAHFEYVASPVMHSLQDIALATGVPCIAGVLTTETVEQAWDRAGGSAGHKGRESALAALYTADLIRTLRSA
ncbi:MAG: 6,7-dimethyl-8-ribityllumazine synthase [Ignavibacteria bacterium]|nr:6,7-dimethyl-8-ribityllumazine synthase [Ignavibacteria bacterium]